MGLSHEQINGKLCKQWSHSAVLYEQVVPWRCYEWNCHLYRGYWKPFCCLCSSHMMSLVLCFQVDYSTCKMLSAEMPGLSITLQMKCWKFHAVWAVRRYIPANANLHMKFDGSEVCFKVLHLSWVLLCITESGPFVPQSVFPKFRCRMSSHGCFETLRTSVHGTTVESKHAAWDEFCWKGSWLLMKYHTFITLAGKIMTQLVNQMMAMDLRLPQCPTNKPFWYSEAEVNIEQT